MSITSSAATATAATKIALEVARRSKSAAQLAAASGVSERHVRRVLQALPQIVQSGKASRTRYATAKPLRGTVSALPLYAIDESGRASALAQLQLIEPEGCLCDLSTHMPCSPQPPDELTGKLKDGWWDGLPYAIYHMQPVGHLGRQFARHHAQALQVAPDPSRWGDEQIVWVLSRVGSDTSGCLVLGDEPMGHVLAWQQSPPAPVAHADVPLAYAALADQSMRDGNPGRSAAGEFPKFTALRELPLHEAAHTATPHVLVKFSAGRASSSPNAAATRWADLLVCEHLALQALRQHSMAAAHSRIVQAQGRTCLETERFDRVGLFGRKPLVSLQAAGDCLLGMADRDWPEVTQTMQRHKWLSEDDAHRAAVLWWFGHLIANTDMHHGNLSLWFKPSGFDLAPAYDMLPMAFAPLASGELRNPDIRFSLPLPAQRAAWQQAAAIALDFWQAVQASNPALASMQANASHAAEKLRLAIQTVG